MRISKYKVRRYGLMLMGFCPVCYNYNDAFPSVTCVKCKGDKAMKERKLNERAIPGVNVSPINK